MSAALATTVAAPRPPVRLRPAPSAEPPYDDETTRTRPPDGPVRHAGPHDIELPLDWGRSRPQRGRTTSRQRPPHRAGRAAPRPGPSGWRVVADNGAPLAIKRFLDMYVEVLNERRPLRHLVTYATDDVFEAIQLGLARRGRDWWPVGRRLVVRRAAPVPLRSRPVPIRVQRIRTCEPVEGVVEVTAVLRRGDEVRALAVRLERRTPHWICTALEFVS